MFGGDFKAAVPTTEPHHIAYPVRNLLDIPTGRFIQTDKGNWVMMGGYADIDSVVGPGNSFKSEQIMYAPLTVFSHIPSSGVLNYDTENSMSYGRIQGRAKYMPGLEDFDFAKEAFKENPRFILTQRAKIEGDVIFEHVKTLGQNRAKNAKKLMRKTPINNPDGTPMMAFPPMVFLMDSLSAFSVSSVQDKIIDKNNVGDSGANVVFMKDGAAKTQLMNQLPDLSGRMGIHVSMTAHIGTFIQMDPYAPPPPKLAFGRNGTKHKGVPEKFSFFNTHLRDVMHSTPLYNSSSDKSPMFPISEIDREKGNDLFLVTSISSRSKYGPSGVSYPTVISQREGILPYMSEFFYIKRMHKNFGVSGNDRSYCLDLCPDTILSRTTARKLLKENWRLQTAVRLTAEILQVRNLWDYDPELVCDPKELYDDIKALGYDWDVLLNTRYWWCFEGEENEQSHNELTLWDLYHMRKGTYHPYWLEDDKKTIKKKYMKSVYAE